jgi:hypothetical protein
MHAMTLQGSIFSRSNNPEKLRKITSNGKEASIFLHHDAPAAAVLPAHKILT